MAGNMDMRKNIRGFYTLEAAIMLPLVILAIFSLGYFMKVEAAWENCLYIAVDESSEAAAKSYATGVAVIDRNGIEERILRETPEIDNVEIIQIATGFADMHSDKLTAYKIRANMMMEMPAGFSRKFEFATKVKFRGFVGVQNVNSPMGADNLEKDVIQDPVSIFPLAGKKYHSASCSYVKATVTQKVLTSNLKKKYSGCSLCDSKNMALGSVVFCFASDDTAYHRGTCRTIKRHTAVIDRSDAIKRGYTRCSKCGG